MELLVLREHHFIDQTSAPTRVVEDKLDAILKCT